MRLPQSDNSVRIEQIQLEQDTAKSNYDQSSAGSVVDLNRAGSALMEIVSRPDIRYVHACAIPLSLLKVPRSSSPEQAGKYVRTLQALLRSVGASDGSMEQVSENSHD